MLSRSPQTAHPTYYEFLELATRKGAEALGIEDKVGFVEPGKRADINIFDMLNPYLTPTRDPLTSIVLYGTPGDIDTVIVDGKILKRSGALTTIEMRDALPTAQKRTDEIVERFFEDHPYQRKNWGEMAQHGRR